MPDRVGDQEAADYCRDHLLTGNCPLCVAEIAQVVRG
jgi:hypothetical protein